MRDHSFPANPPRDQRPDVTQSELVAPPETAQPEGIDKQTLKTGTTTIGIAASDGVVLVTDQRASLGNMVSSKTVQKVEQVHPTAAITIAGSVSAAQSLIRTIKAESKLYEVRRNEPMSMEALSTLLSNLLRSGAFFVVVPILGGVDGEGAHVYSFDALGGVTEEEYTVSGSGTQFALGVLEDRFEAGLDLDAARDVAIDAITSSIERDTASGNGIHVGTITSDEVQIESYPDLNDL